MNEKKKKINDNKEEMKNYLEQETQVQVSVKIVEGWGIILPQYEFQVEWVTHVMEKVSNNKVK